MCYSCHPKRGDVLDLVQLLGLATDLPSAATYITGNNTPLPVLKRKKLSMDTSSPKLWRSATWQANADQLLKDSQANIESPAGAQARAYLQARAIVPEVWRLYGIGAQQVWHPSLETSLPAIVIPWQAQLPSSKNIIKAVQYRFIDDNIEKGQRFSQMAGGERGIFGYDWIDGPDKADRILLIEGELNCISVQQWLIQTNNHHHLDVVSYGPDTNAFNGAAAKLARKYKQATYWADKHEVATTAAGEVPGARAVASPGGLDANDLLRDNKIDNYLSRLLRA